MRNNTVIIHKVGDILVDSFHYLALLSVAILILSYTGKHFGCPEDSELKDER
jgi:hypothetical protein